MEKRVLLEKRGRSSSQVKELVLDNCRSTCVMGVTDEFCNLEKLSMINVGLTNLKGFPKLPNLKKLELSDNRISGGLNHVSSNCPKLQSLNLSGNKINNIEALEPLSFCYLDINSLSTLEVRRSTFVLFSRSSLVLEHLRSVTITSKILLRLIQNELKKYILEIDCDQKQLTNLKYLELANCEVAAIESYREKVFALFSNLKSLDGFDKNEDEAEESDTENGTNDNKDKEVSDEDEENLDEEDEESDDDDVGLSYLQKSQIDEESEGDDYSPEDDDSDVEIDESEEEENPRGEKRKLENDD